MLRGHVEIITYEYIKLLCGLNTIQFSFYYYIFQLESTENVEGIKGYFRSIYFTFYDALDFKISRIFNHFINIIALPIFVLV